MRTWILSNLLLILYWVGFLIKYIKINQNTAPVVICSDSDFELALSIVEISLESSLKIIRMLPKATSTELIGKKMEFFKTLPSKFTH